MAINSFKGNTFVAFLDISGFKNLMQENKARGVLDKFYQFGYTVLRNQGALFNHRVGRDQNEPLNHQVEGFFISDCGILFVRESDGNEIIYANALRLLLNTIKNLNIFMLQEKVMLTTSIAYGEFEYQDRFEYEGIDKNLIYGDAYVSAFLDNESQKPKIQAGQCRILEKDLPTQVIQNIESNQNDPFFEMIKKEKNHYYYFWSVAEPHHIQDFEVEYKNAKYNGILSALTNDVNPMRNNI